MKRLLNIAKGLLGLLALGALAVALALALGELRRDAAPASFQSPVETPTWPPYPPPITPAPSPPTMPAPPCTFVGRPALAEPGPSLEAYQFSEPKIVLTHPAAIGIAGWLPDGQRLLITRLTSDQSGEYIETFDVQTKELQRYGEWHGFSVSFNPKPVWLASEQAVAFVDKGVLYIGRGKGAPAEEVVTDLTSPYLAASPDGQRVVFFVEATKQQPQVFDMALAQRQPLPFILPWMSPQDLSALGQRERPTPYRAAWHHDGNQIAFYNNTGFYLTDLTTGQICEIDLGPHVDGKRWAVDAQWSPNGRYLAALTTVGDPVVRFIDLTLIDMHTGEYRHFDLGHHQYLTAMAWAPNGHDLLVLAEADQGDIARANQYDMYLVDAASGNSRQMLTEYPLILSGVYGIAWSPNGQEIALACPTLMPTEPTIAEGRLCIISVEVKR